MQQISEMHHLDMVWTGSQNTKHSLPEMQAKKTAVMVNHLFFLLFFPPWTTTSSLQDLLCLLQFIYKVLIHSDILFVSHWSYIFGGLSIKLGNILKLWAKNIRSSNFEQELCNFTTQQVRHTIQSAVKQAYLYVVTMYGVKHWKKLSV